MQATSQGRRARLSPQERKTRQFESLERATSGLSFLNYETIIREFVARGIPADQIMPRENVLTCQAWKALGRHVRRGEHGVRILTWIPMGNGAPDVDQLTGAPSKQQRLRPVSAVVFHVSQTDADSAGGAQ